MTQHWHDESTTGAGAQRLSAEWGRHLHDRGWSHWCTLTADGADRGGRRHRRHVTDGWLRAEFTRFHRRVESMTQQPVRFACVVEGIAAGHAHLHCLLADAESIAPDRVRRAWKAGVSTVARFDHSRGAGYYLAKTLGTDSDNLWLSDYLPPRLHLEPDDADSVGDENAEAAMLELVRPERPETGAKSGKPLDVARVASLEVVDPKWANTMASIILRRLGIAA